MLASRIGLLQYLAKNMVFLVQKLWGGKKLSKSVFSYIKTNFFFIVQFVHIKNLKLAKCYLSIVY